MRPIDADALERKAKREATEAWKMSLKAPVETTLNQFIDWIKSAPTVGGWVSVKDRLPKKHGINDHEADVLLYIPKREGCRQYGIYIGFPKETPMPPDDGSGNFWGVPCPGSDWTVWGWSHFEEPIVTHWMPLPALPEEVNEDA